MFHKDAPENLNSIVPPQISETHQYNTRRSSNTVYLNCRTFYYQNSFLPSSIKLWNNIPNDIRLNSSKCCFKRFLNRNLCKKSYYFNFGSRKEQTIFVRLCLKCSSLKDHLFQKNYIDSGLCTCEKIETTAHYLLHCPNYIFIRNETIQTLGTIDVQSLIFGNIIKNENEDRLVFETVSKYIARTKRFD
jgi:hypothetical protein